METLIEFLIYFAIGYFGYYFFSTIANGFRRAKILHEARDLVAKRVHVLKVEKHGDSYFWFDSESDQFIAQGKTIEDFQKVLREVHPAKVFLYNNYCFVGPDFDPIPMDGSEETAKKLENML